VLLLRRTTTACSLHNFFRRHMPLTEDITVSMTPCFSCLPCVWWYPSKSYEEDNDIDNVISALIML
jgi:hypothetical protein